MGNSVYEENKRLREEVANADVRARQAREDADQKAASDFALIISGLCAILIGEAAVRIAPPSPVNGSAWIIRIVPAEGGAP